MAKKAQLGYQEIEERLRYFHEHSVSVDDVAYQLLYCFGKSEAEIRRWREGKGTLKTFDGLLIKGLIAYQTATTQQLGSKLEALKHDQQVTKAAPKIVAVSDGRTLLAYDLREHETYENPLQNLCYDFTFFYPLMNVEKVRTIEENPADVKAAEKLAKLHDEIRAFNEFTSDSDLHDLNIFITRLLFCFFAEDTGIFEENLFTNSVRTYTLDDGSDLAHYLGQAFDIMDVSEGKRNAETNTIVGHFPYVNGGLFSHHIQIPSLSARARRIILECGELNWQDINPDIFGSMIQAVVNPDVRANQGMHYTSVPNIMKVINPLFFDDLRSEYDAIAADAKAMRQNQSLGMLNENQYKKAYAEVEKRCNKLLLRMKKMKFFDPACGSGNFLIITYKALRLLEMDILAIMRDSNPQGTLQFIDGSVISVHQFYGIELLDFPHEVAMLSLWLAEHQMNKKLNEGFGINTRALPLQNITQIVCDNACRVDWGKVCPHDKEDEVFVFGNPPYLGTKWQLDEQKADVDFVMNDNELRRTLDYISCWFVKGARYIKETSAKVAFVSTNSICQGEQVSALWSYLNRYNIHIDFCHTSFRWENNAKNNAGVTCVIVGLSSNPNRKRRLYSNGKVSFVDNINCYLLAAPNIIVHHRSIPLSKLPQMTKGSQPTDAGFLQMEQTEKDELLKAYPQLENYIKRYMGAEDLINGKIRYCLWLKTCDDDILKIPEIAVRINKVRETRLASKKAATRIWAEHPHQFTEDRQPNCDYIILPVVSSEKRIYIPTDYVSKEIIANTNTQMIPTEDFSTFGIVNSLIHNIWMHTVCGRLEMRYAYSASVVYNTFPFPSISESKKSEIESAAEEVLLARENYPGSTLADLYDPDKMPQDLLEAHHRLDDIVESCYPGYPFANDEARLECLFKLYEKMTKK